MSSKAIELQRIIPEGSIMSDQFDQSYTSASETVVGSVAPLYSTVPEAHNLHSRYHSEQVHSVPGQPPQQPDTPNEYDLIDQHKLAAGGGGGTTAPVVKYQADNVLYGDQMAAEQMRHQTLTLEKQKKYVGSTLNEPRFKSGSRLCKPKTMFCCFFVSVSFLMAAGALALVIVLIVGAYPLPCDCQQSLSDLTANLTSMTMELAELRAQVANQEPYNTRLEALEAITVARNEPTVMPFSNCSVGIEAYCVIPVDNNMIALSNLCETPSRPVNETGMIMTDVHCVYDGNNTDANPLVGTPNFIGSEVQCLCAVIIANGGIPQVKDISCGLRITRCPESVGVALQQFTVSP